MNDRRYFADADALSAAVADQFTQCVQQAVADRGVFRVSLSGGSTPRKLYQLLAKRDLPWRAMHFYWGDERNVPPAHDDSNQRMVRQAMLIPADVPEANIHPVPVDVDDPAAAAAAYREQLRRDFGDDALPRWDLCLLGMGDDAHTASLFPGTDATARSASGREEQWFVETFVEKFDAYRYSLTAPAIQSARQRWFLISGENKREALASVWAINGDANRSPARMVQEATWWLTEDARPDASA